AFGEAVDHLEHLEVVAFEEAATDLACLQIAAMDGEEVDEVALRTGHVAGGGFPCIAILKSLIQIGNEGFLAGGGRRAGGQLGGRDSPMLLDLAQVVCGKELEDALKLHWVLWWSESGV